MQDSTGQDFTGKVAITTGTSGIGKGAALRLARGGAKVVALGLDAAANAVMREEAAAENLAVTVQQADVTDEAAVATAVRTAVDEFGGLDILVNSAAIHPYGDATETDFAGFMRCMAVNVGGIFLLAHHAVPEMRRRGGGSIVNVSSAQGHANQKRVSAYATSKGAIHTLTRTLAVDFAKDKIRVNSVSPGSVRTPILELAARTFDGPDADIEAVFARFGAGHPLGRIGEVAEVAELIAFLASDKSSFCTGGDYAVDGGLGAALGVA
jgi:meso-butanediol dehydrogenase/(S,S)-butanediol dehydrogenase/diacetyl reductase